jgi:hypothetical protein
MLAVMALPLRLVSAEPHHPGSRELDTPPASFHDSVTSRAGAAVRASNATVTGNLEVHSGFASPELGNRRRLFVLLPPHYGAEPQRRYAVLYAQDGQDLFDTETAAGGEEWALDELLDAKPPGIPALIVVGIEAVPQAMVEYAPPGSREDARADAYLQFLAREVKPFIDAHYRTLPGPENAVLMGEGAGGLFSVYGSWRMPKTFGIGIGLGLPDMDRRWGAWSQAPPADGQPRLWIEQTSGDMARGSTTSLLATLQRSADVRVVMAGLRSGRLLRLATALRALLPP